MFSLNRECAPLGYGSWQCMLDYHTSKSTRIINWRISGKIYIYAPGEHSSLFHHTSKNEPKTRFFLNDVQQSQPKTDCSSSTFSQGEKKKHSTTFTKGKNLENGEALELIKLTLGNAMPKEGLNPPMLPSLSAGEDLEVG